MWRSSKHSILFLQKLWHRWITLFESTRFIFHPPPRVSFTNFSVRSFSVILLLFLQALFFMASLSWHVHFVHSEPCTKAALNKILRIMYIPCFFPSAFSAALVNWLCKLFSFGAILAERLLGEFWAAIF